jgi:predicted nuclease of predicted toxin-antitoxin system
MDNGRTATKLLLDEHYPPRLRNLLIDQGFDAVCLTHDRPHLRGRPDSEVLRTAANEGRVVVTEDVGTFMAAVAIEPNHCGIVFCHQLRFPRTPAGIGHLAKALSTLLRDPPRGLGRDPLIWWLAESD